MCNYQHDTIFIKTSTRNAIISNMQVMSKKLDSSEYLNLIHDGVKTPKGAVASYNRVLTLI